MTDDFTDEVNILDPNPLAEHDEWEQTIKDDGTLKPVNERYRVRQSSTDYPRVWCGTCNIALEHDPTYILAELLAAAIIHETEVHS